MGKDGDQTQRLFRAPADVFLVQYWGQMDESILEQMRLMVTATSLFEKRTNYYGIIDGQDTQRIILAYQEYFPQEASRPEPEVEPRGYESVACAVSF